MLKVIEETRVVRSFSAAGAAVGNRTPRSFPGNGFETTLAGFLGIIFPLVWAYFNHRYCGTCFVPVAPTPTPTPIQPS